MCSANSLLEMLSTCHMQITVNKKLWRKFKVEKKKSYYKIKKKKKKKERKHLLYIVFLQQCYPAIYLPPGNLCLYLRDYFPELFTSLLNWFRSKGEKRRTGNWDFKKTSLRRVPLVTKAFHD